MINSRNLESSLNFLITEIDTFNRKINNDMDAPSFNNVLKDIETHINKLYEKMRVLEDVKNYIKTFTVKAIEERRNKIINDQKVIEAAADKSNGAQSIVEVINFNSYNQYITDRDGEIIEHLNNTNGRLSMPSKIVDKETLIGIVNKGQVKTTSELDIDSDQDTVQLSQAEELNELSASSIDNKPFIGVYESFDAATNGLLNEYEITFGSRANCNKIELNPINCEIEKIIVTTFDGKVVEINNDKTYLEEPIDIEKMNVLVSCKNYKYEPVSYIDEPTKDSFDNSFVEV